MAWGRKRQPGSDDRVLAAFHTFLDAARSEKSRRVRLASIGAEELDARQRTELGALAYACLEPILFHDGMWRDGSVRGFIAKIRTSHTHASKYMNLDYSSYVRAVAWWVLTPDEGPENAWISFLAIMSFLAVQWPDPRATPSDTTLRGMIAGQTPFLQAVWADMETEAGVVEPTT